MTTTVHKYRVWCNNEQQWIEVWSPSEPTTCPHDGNDHTIDDNKTVIVETVTQLFPMSDIGDKIAVHSSPKPIEATNTTYAVWTGAGDDIESDPPIIGDGDLLHYSFTPGVASIAKDLKFHPSFGKVWVHEAYVRYSGAGSGDYVTAFVVVPVSQLQPYANLFLYVDADNWVKSVPLDGSITPTHGFAATPYLMPRTFSHDGDWDYDGENLIPNYNGTGGYKISSIERIIHRFVNKIPISGSNPYFELSSDESAWLPPGYFLRIVGYNNSNTEWNMDVFVEIYREMTYKP